MGPAYLLQRTHAGGLRLSKPGQDLIGKKDEVFTGPIARDRVRTDATRPGVDAAQRHTQERGDLADAKEGRAGRVRHRQRPSWVVPVPSGSGPIPARRKRPWRT